MDGYQVAKLDSVIDKADIIVTSTDCFNVVTAEHMRQMNNRAILPNAGHFDDGIDMAGLAKAPGISKQEIKPKVHEWTFDDGDSIIGLSEGRLMNRGSATGHPSFGLSNSFSNLPQVMVRRRRLGCSAAPPRSLLRLRARGSYRRCQSGAPGSGPSDPGPAGSFALPVCEPQLAWVPRPPIRQALAGRVPGLGVAGILTDPTSGCCRSWCSFISRNLSHFVTGIPRARLRLW